MSKKKSVDPNFKDKNADRNRKLKTEPDTGNDRKDLLYNEEENSFELDVNSNDNDYDHPDPYDTAVKNGGDFDSDYDEANPTAVDEYDKDRSLENDVEKLGMHIDNGDIVHVDSIDAEMSKTPEDNRTDLDEEGYPKNDEENFK